MYLLYASKVVLILRINLIKLVKLDMSKAFDTINICVLIRRLLQITDQPTRHKHEFIANYIKEHNAYTTYRNYTFIQRQFKTGVPQGGVLSPTLFNIYTADLLQDHLYTPAARLHTRISSERAEFTTTMTIAVL